MDKQHEHDEEVRRGIGDPAKERTVVDPPTDHPERELPEVDETDPNQPGDTPTKEQHRPQ